jgi:hypothetical protein
VWPDEGFHRSRGEVGTKEARELLRHRPRLAGIEASGHGRYAKRTRHRHASIIREGSTVRVASANLAFVVRPPRSTWWLFWDVDPTRLDLPRDADYIIPRVLERGRLVEVGWLLDRLGKVRIHEFLRDQGHPELSAATLAFWRNYLHAEDETWAQPPAFRKHKSLSSLY